MEIWQRSRQDKLRSRAKTLVEMRLHPSNVPVIKNKSLIIGNYLVKERNVNISYLKLDKLNALESNLKLR